MDYAHRDDVKAGTKLRADGGFTCIKRNAMLTVEQDDHGLFVPCRDTSKQHYLDGQLDDGERYIGFRLAKLGDA